MSRSSNVIIENEIPFEDIIPLKIVTEGDIRNIRQQEAVDSFHKRGLIKAAPRFGKIKATIGIFNRDKPKNILIAYPRTDIQTGWATDFKKFKYNDANVSYQTFKSIKKEVNKKYDFYVFDEIHEASVNQLKEIKEVIKGGEKVLLLSGTVTNKTQREIEYHLGIRPCYNYTIKKAVEEGILCDYNIIIHEVPLDNKEPIYTGKTERKKFSNYEFVKAKLRKEGKPTFFLDLKQIQIIQNSISKLKKTKELLGEFKNQRVLVFCGTTEIADNLDIPVYHSKAKEKDVFADFCSGKGNHLATIKMAQSGITVLPIHKGLINYTSGNPEDSAQKICRFLGLEYDNPDKKAEIHMVVSEEDFEKERIETALMFFDEDKIKRTKY